MIPIKAVYRKGVFQPLEPVDLPEEQRVELNVEPTRNRSILSWLDQVRALQNQIIARRGVLPDSSLEISADRGR